MTKEDVERCQMLQTEEIEALDAIFPDLITVHDNPSGKPGILLSLTLPISLPSETVVRLSSPLSAEPVGPSSSSIGSTSSAPVLQLSHLPPLTCRLLFPSSYPTSEAPRVVQLKASLPNESSGISWLPRAALRMIQNKLGEMWEEEREMTGEGVGVVWRWWEWIAAGDFLGDLKMMDSNGVTLGVPPMVPAATLHTLLKKYNARQLHTSFEATAFACTICFESRKGKSCVQMPCGCVFCNPCLNSCWTLAINEGTLEQVSCPSPACVKKRATRDPSGVADEGHADMDPTLVESVVGTELRERWEELASRRRAETDPTYCICPRPQCQAPVPPPPLPSAQAPTSSTSSTRTIRLSDLSSSSSTSSATIIDPPVPPLHTTASPQDDRWSRYRQCPTCCFSFCLYCSATWHGAHTPCSFPQTSALVLEYLSYPEDSVGRRRMEQRRGKKNMERMVARYIEDEENKKWLESKTRACAGCGVRVEKSHGCNHMTCGRCGAHFCYRCGESLRPTDPYAHYRKPGSCFERLFDQEEVDRFERETAMQQAGMGAAGQLIGDEWGPRGIWEW